LDFYLTLSLKKRGLGADGAGGLQPWVGGTTGWLRGWCWLAVGGAVGGKVDWEPSWVRLAAPSPNAGVKMGKR